MRSARPSSSKLGVPFSSNRCNDPPRSATASPSPSAGCVARAAAGYRFAHRSDENAAAKPVVASSYWRKSAIDSAARYVVQRAASRACPRRPSALRRGVRLCDFTRGATRRRRSGDPPMAFRHHSAGATWHSQSPIGNRHRADTASDRRKISWLRARRHARSSARDRLPQTLDQKRHRFAQLRRQRRRCVSPRSPALVSPPPSAAGDASPTRSRHAPARSALPAAPWWRLTRRDPFVARYRTVHHAATAAALAT